MKFDFHVLFRRIDIKNYDTQNSKKTDNQWKLAPINLNDTKEDVLDNLSGNWWNSFVPYFTEECTTGGEHPAVLLLLCTADTSDLIDGLLGVLPDTAKGRNAA